MLKQGLQFKLLQKLSPQQIQLMKLIQLPTQAFEERLKEEMEENPALDDGKEESENFDDDLSNEFDDDNDSDGRTVLALKPSCVPPTSSSVHVHTWYQG